MNDFQLVASAVKTVRWARRKKLELRYRSLTYGDEFIAGPRMVLARGAVLRAGDHVSIGPDFHCLANAYIGDDVMISSRVGFIGDDHPLDDPDGRLHGMLSRPLSSVTLEGRNLIGHAAIILGPVTIGRGTVVGAGSLVTHDLPPGTICVGRPATPVRKRLQ